MATWGEIDLEAAVWEIPAERHKSKRGLRVPLSRRSLAILSEARKRADGQPPDTALVFPSPTTGRPLSDAILSTLVRELDIGSTVHGMRASLRTWCAEGGVSREVAEMMLGHAIAGVEGAYQHSDLLEARREVAECWASAIRAV